MNGKGRPRLHLSDEQRKQRTAEQKRSFKKKNREQINESKRVSTLSHHQQLQKRNRNHLTVIRKNAIIEAQLLGCMNNVENVSYLDTGDMESKCTFCNGLSFKNEIGRSKHSCCHGGKINMEQLRQYPKDLLDMLFLCNEDARHFRENIRVYNNAFAFASFNSISADISGRGPYCMRIVGQPTTKATTSLISKDKAKYGQVYIYDDNETVKFRLYSNTRENVLLKLQLILKNNPYAACYRQLYDVYKSTKEDTLTLNFLSYSNDDQRRYNQPSINSIAAIIVSKEGNIPDLVDVKVFPKSDKESEYLSTTSQHCDPMLFPLLFPNGEQGWSHLMKTRFGKNITPLQYYSFRLSERFHEINPLLCAGRLTQQYIIHAYLTVESQRLKYIRFNQKKLRTECYHGLIDHIQKGAANNAINLKAGNLLILPSTFAGSPRSMQQLYQDAMAICRKIGRPDLFITMTCNPAWPEVKRYISKLPSGTSATDIPLFICRLFYQKVNSLIKDLNSIFGGTRAYVYTVEFQKRGLPHVHLLVTLKKKLLTADDVDMFISAEIPDIARNPSLRYKVIKHMLHGPHGANTPCYDKESQSCSKHFPKPFRISTEMNTKGFPNYRRIDNSDQLNTYNGKYCGNIINVDNSMVVPYNPFLLMKYNCHINVEYCASVMGIKYIHKYIHKGHDRARLEVFSTQNHEETIINDEIKEYVDARFLSASESSWRILELPMHGRSHSVERLPVHLQGMNHVIFEEGKEVQAAERNVNTKLTAYFELNRSDELARSLKYEDIPLHYRWIDRDKKWQKRERDAAIISRIITVSAREVELFHLKILLRKIRGAKSFEDLKTYEDVVYPTYKDAAYAYGFISSDTEITEVLREATTCLMPHELRKFFVYILIGCSGVDGVSLWSSFRKQLSEDTTPNIALKLIGQMLEEENLNLKRFGFQETDDAEDVILRTNDATILKHEDHYIKMFNQLNKIQKSVFEAIATSVIGKKENNCFYVDGPAGSGKTFLYECLIHFITSRKLKVMTLAWTGIAAILLPHGKTAHKSFQLPLNMDDVSTLYWTKKTKSNLKDADVFIWDEASMIPSAALESIDIALRDICCCSKPFGGKLFLLGGDFRQILPVVKRAGKSQVIQSTVKSSHLWQNFQCYHLSENMRCSSDSKFSQWLLSIGNGDTDYLEIQDSMLSTDLVSDMYSDIGNNNRIAEQAILSPRNDDVAAINHRILDLLPGKTYTSEGVDRILERGADGTDDRTDFMYPLEYINSLTPSGFPPQKLLLKEGAIVMLIRNLSTSDGLCNGTRLIVKNVKKRVLCCKILTGDKLGSVVYIPKITLDSSADTELPFVLHRTQFPVRLSFAMTINKSQGQSFDKIGLYFTANHTIFSHGQLYVAFSRCRTFDGIKVQLPPASNQKNIRNIVYKEVLF